MNRTKTIKVRLTDDEFRQLKALAGKRGVSALLRRRGLGEDQRQDNIERLPIVAELARARNLLNEIARNCERHTHTDQIQIVAELIVVERRLSIFKKL